MEPTTAVPASVPKTRNYWQAQGLAELALSEFQAATAENDLAGQRRAFYQLASYYGRTMHILRSALKRGNEPLAEAAMSNLVTLHRPLTQMHRRAPDDVPVTLTLDRKARDVFVRDLIVRVLAESGRPLGWETVYQRVNDLDIMGTIRKGTVQRHLKNLIETGHVERVEGGYRRADRVYAELAVDALSLRALVGEEHYQGLVAADFRGLREISSRQGVFVQQFMALTGLSEAGALQFVGVVSTLLDTQPKGGSACGHADQVNKTHYIKGEEYGNENFQGSLVFHF